MLLASLEQLFDPLLTEFAPAMVVAKEQTSTLAAVEQMSALAVAEQGSVPLLGAGIE